MKSIKMNDGSLKRITDKEAMKFVDTKQAKYISKQEYKKVNVKGVAEMKANPLSNNSQKKNNKKVISKKDS